MEKTYENDGSINATLTQSQKGVLKAKLLPLKELYEVKPAMVVLRHGA